MDRLAAMGGPVLSHWPQVPGGSPGNKSGTSGMGQLSISVMFCMTRYLELSLSCPELFCVKGEVPCKEELQPLHPQKPITGGLPITTGLGAGAVVTDTDTEPGAVSACG